MMRLLFIVICLTQCLSIFGQGRVFDIKVTSHFGLHVGPDTPYLLNGVKYQFIISGKQKDDEILVGIDHGKVTIKDSTLIVTPHYTKGDRHTEPDTATITIRLRDQHQADKGAFKIRYKVYAPLTKREMRGPARLWRGGPGPRGTYLFWRGILADSIDNPEKVLACLDGEFTYSRYLDKDSPRYKMSSIIMNRETVYHPFMTMGTKLSELMIDAIRNEADGCRFIVEFNCSTNFGPRAWRFDTRKGKLIVK